MSQHHDLCPMAGQPHPSHPPFTHSSHSPPSPTPSHPPHPKQCPCAHAPPPTHSFASTLLHQSIQPPSPSRYPDHPLHPLQPCFPAAPPAPPLSPSPPLTRNTVKVRRDMVDTDRLSRMWSSMPWRGEERVGRGKGCGGVSTQPHVCAHSHSAEGQIPNQYACAHPHIHPQVHACGHHAHTQARRPWGGEYRGGCLCACLPACLPGPPPPPPTHPRSSWSPTWGSRREPPIRVAQCGESHPHPPSGDAAAAPTPLMCVRPHALYAAGWRPC